jgi:DNA-binding response OmpR family regulator
MRRVSGFARDPRVLVVEDDEDIALAVQRSLRMEGYEVRLAADGEAAPGRGERVHARSGDPRPRLPKLDGIEVARRLRADGDVPILMLTPATRSRAASRASTRAPTTTSSSRSSARSSWRACAPSAPPPARGSRSYVVGDLSLNPDTHEVQRGERTIELTQREFELLEYLCATSASSCRASGCSKRSGATTRSRRRTPSRCSCRT